MDEARPSEICFAAFVKADLEGAFASGAKENKTRFGEHVPLKFEHLESVDFLTMNTVNRNEDNK